ncbi:MAG: MopE-related protein, partial [Thiogranum sp.]
ITVNDPATGPDPAPSCTDGDGDGFAREGGSCGPVDCNDTDPSINPDAPESCSDGIDNNCNSLADVADPTAIDCPVSDSCFDNDGDRFSPDGGICGPIDCDDFNGTVNPSAAEACDDDIDNDCDGAVDNDDPECNGGDCIAQRFPGTSEPQPPETPSVNVTRAEWDEEDAELKVEGDQASAGAAVTLRNADTGELLATEVAERNGEWEFELDGLAAVPCRVRVEIDGQSPTERSVADAPSDCGSGGSV